MKSVLTRNILLNVGAELIATFVRGSQAHPTSHDNSQPGFYFFVNKNTQLCHARFFAGRQRSAQGLKAIVNNIQRADASNVALQLRRRSYDIFFIHADKMKPLTTGWDKGQIAMMFTKKYQSDYQTLTEMNLMLKDNFKFVAQG